MNKHFVAIFNGAPRLDGPYASVPLAAKAGREWQKNNKDDPRWSTVELEVVTVIWGDTEDNPGVFHFVQVSTDVEDIIREARLQTYRDTSIYEEGDLYEPGNPDVTYTPEEWVDRDESFTLIAVLPGILNDVQ